MDSHAPSSQKNFTTQAEQAQAHALYIQNMMPLMIATILTEQRKRDCPDLPAVTPKVVNNLACYGKWGIERRQYMVKQSETIATALEAIKAEAGAEMVVIIKSLHDSFVSDLDMIEKVRKKVKTPRDALDLAKALEVAQRRLFHFHALRSTPLASQAMPVETIMAGSTALEGGEVKEIETAKD